MIRSRSDDIVQLLLLYFPYDICKLIINFMFQIEFFDSKEIHKRNCLYFNIQNKIGINLSLLKPVNPYHYRFNSELWRHIDYDNKNGNINFLIKGLSHIKFINYIENQVFQRINSRIKSRSGNKILNNLKILENINHFRGTRGVYDIIMHYGHYLTLQADEESNYHYDNITKFNKSNEYISLDKFYYDMKNIFYIHDYQDERAWQDLNMFTINYDQKYFYNRKTSKKRIYHKKTKNNIKFKGR